MKQTTYWSGEVMKKSFALDLEEGVFTWDDPGRIAAPFQSAMSMLNFYINRAGKDLSAQRRGVLTEAKRELRRLFGRQE